MWLNCSGAWDQFHKKLFTQLPFQCGWKRKVHLHTSIEILYLWLCRKTCIFYHILIFLQYNFFILNVSDYQQWRCYHRLWIPTPRFIEVAFVKGIEYLMQKVDTTETVSFTVSQKVQKKVQQFLCWCDTLQNTYQKFGLKKKTLCNWLTNNNNKIIISIISNNIIIIIINNNNIINNKIIIIINTMLSVWWFVLLACHHLTWNPSLLSFVIIFKELSI